MSVTRLDPSSMRALQRDLEGQAIMPGDSGYDRSRAVYNAMHDRWPSLVVRAANTADVAHTVRFAAEEGLMLAVRGGNHSMRGQGSCDDGVVLDLSALRTVEVDPDEGVARVGGGATWADVNSATHDRGLATTGGLISTTGVGGLTLGGGFGYLTRRLGLACDNLTAVELVTARGEVLTADAERAPDLFWAIRGGGGNFGVVTSFTFRLAPVRTVLAGPLVFPADPEVLVRYDEALQAAPRDLSAVLGLTLAPPMPFLSRDRHGTPCAVVIACWSGSAPAGPDALRQLEHLGPRWGQAVRQMPYPELNTLFDGLLPPGLRHYWKSRMVHRLGADGVEPYSEHGRDTPTIESGIFFYPVDGAAQDVGVSETAWPHRDARYVVGFHGSWRDPGHDDAIRAWVKRAHRDCASSALPGGYVNFVSDDEVATTDVYGDNTARLLEVKRAYDPHNLFCLNANLDPDGVRA